MTAGEFIIAIIVVLAGLLFIPLALCYIVEWVGDLINWTIGPWFIDRWEDWRYKYDSRHRRTPKHTPKHARKARVRPSRQSDI